MNLKQSAARSKFAIDIMYRVYDSAHGRWIHFQGKTIWSSRTTPDKIRARMIEVDGRGPDTLSVERVFVSVSIPKRETV